MVFLQEKERARLALEREQTPRIVFKASLAAFKVWVHTTGTQWLVRALSL